MAGDKQIFQFGRRNYIVLIAGVLVLAIGYMLMAGGRSDDPNVFNEGVLSFRRITLAPIIQLLGLAIVMVSIFIKGKMKD